MFAQARVHPWHCVVLVGVGTVLITLAAEAAGPAAPSFALFYVWVALYSFYFFAWRVAVAQWAWSTVAFVAILGRDASTSLGLAPDGSSPRPRASRPGVVVGRLARQVRQMALRDWLTGAVNRRAWEPALEAALARSARSSRPVSVALIDLDNFKELNDRDGHAGGDAVLRACAAAWHDRLRRGDVLARLGGDEFGVILEGCALEPARQVLEDLCGVAPDAPTCSAGLACWDGHEPMASLLARADAALHDAKAAGRDRVTCAGAGTTSSKRRRIGVPDRWLALDSHPNRKT